MKKILNLSELKDLANLVVEELPIVIKRIKDKLPDRDKKSNVSVTSSGIAISINRRCDKKFREVDNKDIDSALESLVYSNNPPVLKDFSSDAYGNIVKHAYRINPDYKGE